MSNTLSNPVEDGLIQGAAAFQDDVNIKLFNDIIAFIVKTTEVETLPVIRELSENHLWYSKAGESNIQEQYGFRYFGELLERFEERTNADIRDIRAVAFALAYAKPLLTDDMFVGNQKRDFINRVKAITAGDTYLKGAVYLLCDNDNAAPAALEELEQAEYTRTEELVFVMSLYDSFDRAFEVFKPQLLNLIGKSRSIPVYGNMGIFAWLFKRFEALLKSCRSKDMALIRALAALPVSFVKAGDKNHTIMLESGYTAEDIVYANGTVLLFKPVRNTLYQHSIVTEKIVVELCRTFINSENTHSDDTYNYLKWLLIAYDSFEIKLQGYKGIIDAVKQDIVIKNPQTFIWLYRFNKKLDIYYFDVLDDKWDILANELGASVYSKLFDNQLIHVKDITTAQINAYIQKHDELTLSSYISTFGMEHEYKRNDVFSLMVERDIINLTDELATCLSLSSYNGKDSGNKPAMLEYIESKVKGLHSRKSFDFFKCFLNDYDFDNMHSLFSERSYYGRSDTHFFLDEFYDRNSYSNSYSRREEHIKIKRDFLSEEEHRMLLGWLDDYMYLYRADEYIDFAVNIIHEPFVSTLYPKDELRYIYNSICEMDSRSMQQYSSDLKRIFLSEDELQAEKEAENASHQRQKELEMQQHTQNLRDSFEEYFDNSFESVTKYLDKHKYSFRDKDVVWHIVAENLERVFAANGYVMDTKETGRFIKLSGQLIKDGFYTLAEFKKHLSNIKEDETYVKNNGTLESDSCDD